MLIYAINLERSEKRRENIYKQKNKINNEIQIWKAVDGLNTPMNELRKMVKPGPLNIFNHTPIVNKETTYACAVSHILLYKKLINSTDNILIIEDDANFINSSFINDFNNIYEYLPSDWDMVFFNNFGRTKHLKHINEHFDKLNNIYWYQHPEAFLTTAYLINPKCIKILSEITINDQIDRIFHRKNLNIYITRKEHIEDNGEPTTRVSVKTPISIPHKIIGGILTYKLLKKYL